MNELNPTSVVEAGLVMAPHLGLDWEINRQEVVNGINNGRNHVYNKYSTKKLFDSSFHCFVPQPFPEECVSRTLVKNCYWGATLPPDMSGVVKAFHCGHPLKIRSRWRESFTGKIQCGRELSVISLGRNFPTERELRQPSRIRFYAESVCDSGKVVYVEARMFGDTIRTLKFPLEGDGWVASHDAVCEILSVALPAGRSGYVTLATEDGTELSVYSPWEIVPSYPRIKFLTGCEGNVFVQGTKRFVPVYFDHDVVEVGDPVFLEFLAGFVRHRMSRDKNEQGIASLMEARAWQNLDSLVARANAGASQDGDKRGKRPNRILPGYGRPHRTR